MLWAVSLRGMTFANGHMAHNPFWARSVQKKGWSAPPCLAESTPCRDEGFWGSVLEHLMTVQALQEVPQSAPELFSLSPQSSPQELSQRLSKSWSCCISYLCHNQSHFWCSVGRADLSCGSWSWDLSGGTGEGHYLLSSWYFMCSEFPPWKLGHSFKNNNKNETPHPWNSSGMTWIRVTARTGCDPVAVVKTPGLTCPLCSTIF